MMIYNKNMPEKQGPDGVVHAVEGKAPLGQEVYPPGILPRDVIRADIADSGTFSASFSADRLLVPAKLIGREQLTDAVLADLRSRTLSFYDKQHARMESQHIPEGKRRGIQEVFDDQVKMFCDVTGGVDTAFRENPALDLILLGWDADNTQGITDEDAPSEITIPDDLQNKSSSEFTPEERRLMEKIYVRDSYNRWVWNPAFLVAAKYSYEKYRDDPKHKVIQAVLTTKDQEGLNDNYATMLDEELPGVFDPRLVMSSNFNTRGSAAEELFPEITPALGNRNKRGRPENSLTVQQTIDLIHASAQEKAILMERILKAKKDVPGKKEPDLAGQVVEGSQPLQQTSDQSVTAKQEEVTSLDKVDEELTGDGATTVDEVMTEFDMKFLMMGRILDRTIREGMGGISPEPPPGVDPEEWHDKLFAERMFILVEDNAHPPILSHSQIGYIQVPRFRTPDSPDDVSGDEFDLTKV